MLCKAFSWKTVRHISFLGYNTLWEKVWEGAGTCDVSVYRTTIIRGRFGVSVSESFTPTKCTCKLLHVYLKFFQFDMVAILLLTLANFFSLINAMFMRCSLVVLGCLTALPKHENFAAAT